MKRTGQVCLHHLHGDGEAILAAAGDAKGSGSLTGLTLPEFLALQMHRMPLVAPLTTMCCGKSNTEGPWCAIGADPRPARTVTVRREAVSSTALGRLAVASRVSL